MHVYLMYGVTKAQVTNLSMGHGSYHPLKHCQCVWLLSSSLFTLFHILGCNLLRLGLSDKIVASLQLSTPHQLLWQIRHP